MFYTDRFSDKVAIPESKCLFGNRDGRLTRVAQQQLLLLRAWHFAVSLISQDENNSLLGTNNVHLDTNNSLLGSKHVFRDTSNSLLGTNNFLVERKIAFRGAASDHSQAKQTSLLQRFELFCKQGYERTVSDSDYENTVKIIGCDSHDKRFPSLSLCSHPTLFHLIILQTPDLCWLQLHAPIPILKSLLTMAETTCTPASAIFLFVCLCFFLFIVL